MTEAQSDIFELFGTPQANGILIVADHASCNVSPEISLGIDADSVGTHIGYDIGVAGVAREMSRTEEIWCFAAKNSRLVVDLNRYADEEAVIPELSDGQVIIGNALTSEQRQRRLDTYYHQYHNALEAHIERYRPSLLLSLHSFTPFLSSSPEVKRPWDIGLMYNDYERASKLCLEQLLNHGFEVGDQKPYSGKEFNATMNRHGEGTNTPYFGVEMRQDVVDDRVGQERFGQILSEICIYITKTLAS